MPEKGNLLLGKEPLATIIPFVTHLEIHMRKFAFRQQAHQQVKMVTHAADTQNFGEINLAESLDHVEKIFFFHIPEWNGKPSSAVCDIT